MIIQFSDRQRELMPVWTDLAVYWYFRFRYGERWRWYYLNWQTNHELLW